VISIDSKVYLYREFSEDILVLAVLTTEFIKGKHLDEWVKGNPSQAVQNAAAQRLENALVYSSLTLKHLHADLD